MDSEKVDSQGNPELDGKINEASKAENSNSESGADAAIENDINEVLKNIEAGADLDKSEENSKSSDGVGASEHQALKDKHLRLYAEFENFRRRSAKENFEIMANANSKLIGTLTDVLDNFSRAFEAQEKNANPEEFAKGIKLIHSQFREILEQEGLESIDPVGQEFDPNLQDALMQQASESVPENHVITVFQKGYKIKGKVLKHAKVIVSKGKE